MYLQSTAWRRRSQSRRIHSSPLHSSPALAPATSASMSLPSSSMVSHLMMLATPWMNMLTRVTSECPSLSALEMSKTPPLASESTPAPPRAWSLSCPQTSLKSDLAENLGMASMHPARRPVPRLERAGEDETEMLGVHEVTSVSGEDLLDGGSGVAESLEDGVDVVTLLHGDDSGVILFVNPNEEVLGLVVEDT